MPGQRKKILWVDDEIEYLRSHIMFLETRGYSVIPVFSGDDAIQIIHQNPKEFDIVLLDEQMPGKDGLTTLEEIKEFDATIPVVMVTKSEEEQVMEDALGKKIDGYLTKPVNPSQILLVCKKILDSKRIISSQVKQKYVRNYSIIKTTLSNRMTTSDWIRLHENLTQWDLELEKLEDEGIRQTHAGQRSDCNKMFSDYVAENYARWIKGEGNPPVLASQVIDKYLYPLLRDGKRVMLVVLSGLRLDQYIEFEQILRKKYSVRRQFHFSMIPSVALFSRNSLFAGALPAEIATRKPALFRTGDESEDQASVYEQELLAEKLQSLGVEVYDNETWFQRIRLSTSTKQISDAIGSCSRSQVHTIVVDFYDLVVQNQFSSILLKEITSDESGLRSLANAWFQRSALLQVIKKLTEENYTLVITSDHGNTMCSRSTELYSAPDVSFDMRYRFGVKISSDERRVVYLSDPSHFGLPVFTPDTRCIVAKEDYFFIQPEKFENYAKKYRTCFQQGGISMDELIMPFGIFEPI